MRGSAALALAFIGLLVAALPVQGNAQQHNILMIILDDVGVDMIGAYQSHEGSTLVPKTPELDRLTAEGVMFTNVWSNPVCAPTRATIQTGRYAYRNMVATPGDTLAHQTLGIADVFNVNQQLGYSKAVFGKWGLRQESVYDEEVIGHVIRSGYDYFAGKPDCCIDEGYFAYVKPTARFDPLGEIPDGPECQAGDPPDPADYQREECTTCPAAGSGSCPDPPSAQKYATTENVDDVISWLTQLDPGQSWFITLSFNASHDPLHGPPDENQQTGQEQLWRSFDPGTHIEDEFTRRCNIGLLGSQTCYRAAVEAVDKEIERLLATTVGGTQLIDPDSTTVIVLGDNGSIGAHDGVLPGVAAPPFDRRRAKQTLYEGGINVSGKDVVPAPEEMGEPVARVSEALVNSSDLFVTILELADVDIGTLPPDPSGGGVPDIDSYSLIPILGDGCTSACSTEREREYVFAEINQHDRKGKTIRNRLGYKLILQMGPFHYRIEDEEGNLLEEEDVVDNPGDPADPFVAWELYYLGGDPSAPLAAPDPTEQTNLVDPLSGQLVATLPMGHSSEHLQPILDDLRGKLGAVAPGTGPALAARNKCDVNGDQRIDSADVLRAMQLAATGSGTASEMARADVAPPNDSASSGGGDGDGIVDSADILLILRAVSGDPVNSCDHTLI